MEYIFGIANLDGEVIENLKTVGDEHTELSGYVETRRAFADCVICDRFRVVRKYRSMENSEKKFDLYHITDHYRYTELSQQMREELNSAKDVSRVSFVALSESGSIANTVMVEHVELYDEWKPGESVKEGNLRKCGASGEMRLYRCRQAHTTQADRPPHLTPALWVVVDVAHAGTQDDPIPAARGMEYTYGLYYLDSEDGKTYKCERVGEAAGGKIVLQYLPHELVGNYFSEVAA